MSDSKIFFFFFFSKFEPGASFLLVESQLRGFFQAAAEVELSKAMKNAADAAKHALELQEMLNKV